MQGARLSYKICTGLFVKNSSNVSLPLSSVLLHVVCVCGFGLELNTLL